MISPNRLIRSARSLLETKTSSNAVKCSRDETTSEIFYQLAATFNKSLFTGMLFYSSEFSDLLFQPTFVFLYISAPEILIKFDFENNQISFM